jgi:CelD/BcsL family acetyltransferase involved in cellulose biosynthesis
METVTGTAVAGEAFQRFLAIEASGWKGQEGTALAADLTKQRFYETVLSRFSQQDRARIDFLTIGGVPAAAHLAIRTARTWSLLKIGYDPAFKAYGPGGILLRLFINEMVANPDIDEVNLTTNPKWAERWHFNVEPVYNVIFFGRTLRGRGLAAERFAKELMKGIRARVSRSRPVSRS